jgi:hypothetical protein
MKAIALFALVALACATAPFDAHVGGEVIEGHYIVVFKTDIASAARDAHYNTLALAADEEITHKYEFPGFSGYAARLSKSNLAIVLEDETVAYAEVNQMAHATACESATVVAGLWGLSRTVRRNLPNDFMFEFNRARGFAVNAFIIDTGVYCLHSDFNNGRSRCRAGHDEFPSEGGSNVDLNGHGTHVAGTVAGNRYGFCKDCNIVAVKVLSRAGSGTFAGVINGINWTANQHQAGQRSVGNMSLGGGRSQAVNDATDACVNRGVHMAVASGNGNTNACNTSPASSPRAITVNSITNTDARSSFSNIGTCTDIFAPGSNVLSAWIGNPEATSTISGTSMASPHTAGVVCELISEPGGPANPDALKARLFAESTPNVVTNPGNGSPNRLLFHACLDD